MLFIENVGHQDKNAFEGDMILTKAQRMAAMRGEDVSKAGMGRSSIREGLWPGAVLVYELDSELGNNKINVKISDYNLKMTCTYDLRVTCPLLSI